MSTQAQKGSHIDVDFNIIILIKYHSVGDWLQYHWFRCIWRRKSAEVDGEEARSLEACRHLQAVCLFRDMERLSC